MTFLERISIAPLQSAKAEPHNSVEIFGIDHTCLVKFLVFERILFLTYFSGWIFFSYVYCFDVVRDSFLFALSNLILIEFVTPF